MLWAGRRSMVDRYRRCDFNVDLRLEERAIKYLRV